MVHSGRFGRQPGADLVQEVFGRHRRGGAAVRLGRGQYAAATRVDDHRAPQCDAGEQVAIGGQAFGEPAAAAAERPAVAQQAPVRAEFVVPGQPELGFDQHQPFPAQHGVVDVGEHGAGPGEAVEDARAGQPGQVLLQQFGGEPLGKLVRLDAGVPEHRLRAELRRERFASA